LVDKEKVIYGYDNGFKIVGSLWLLFGSV